MSHAHARMVIFDDGRGQFGPLTDLRAAFELRTGVLTTAERLCTVFPRALCAYHVPADLEALVRARADAPVNLLPEEETLCCVNGRWAAPEKGLLPGVGEAIVEESTGDVIAAVLRRADAAFLLEHGLLHERVRTTQVEGRQLYRYPWDILDAAGDVIDFDIHQQRMPDGVLARDLASVCGDQPIDIAPTARIGPNVTLDAERGPILIADRAVIRPNSVLVGPCAVGYSSTVNEQSIIKANTSIGPHCKVGGEIGGTIIQGYSNKSHHGHLGDSLLGEWVNLGAGTVNSNLLNTYGGVLVRLEPDGPRQRTGRSFFGAVIADHVKTAIGTRIMTGCVLGTGAMVASSTPPASTVRRFAWVTDDGERRYRHDKFVEVMRAVMARREQEPTDAYLARILALYDAKA